jgi:hypothetical protein
MKTFSIKTKYGWEILYVIDYLDYKTGKFVEVFRGSNRRKAEKVLNGLEVKYCKPGRKPASSYTLSAQVVLKSKEQWEYEPWIPPAEWSK